MADLICIKKFGSRHDADVAKSVLDANAIQSFIQSDDAGGMYPFMTEQIRLLVKKTDMQAAQKILQ
ncbi:MAG: hypothetical protein NT149_02915 [Candidatus Gottesmanbacteria bacterium]|nr:hypothetical protein [Candidatus Gottesmanbacteria bacterium]